MAFFFKFLIFCFSVLELQVKEPRGEFPCLNSGYVIPVKQPLYRVLTEAFRDFRVAAFYFEIVIVDHVDQGTPVVAVEEHC